MMQRLDGSTFTPRGKRHPFRGVAQLRSLVEGLEEAEEATDPVTCGAVHFPDQKGLLFRHSREPITTVGKCFQVHQHADLLARVLAALEARNAEPKGTVFESEHGHLLVDACFMNDRYAVPIAFGATDGLLVHLGVTFQNSHGRPYVSLRADCTATGGGRTYVMPRLLGRVTAPHKGTKAAELTKVFPKIVERSPDLARHLRLAADHALDVEDARLALRGLGQSAQAAQDLLTAGPRLSRHWGDRVTAWGLYDALVGAWARKDVQPSTLHDGLLQAERLLQVDKLPGIIQHGREVEARERVVHEIHAPLLEVAVEA